MIKFEDDFLPYLNDDALVKRDIVIENEVFLKNTPQSFTDYENLIVESPRICSVCDKVFQNSFTYLQHNLYHLSVRLRKIYTCTKCEKWFSTNSELDNHKRSHGRVETCVICNKVVSYNYLGTHVKYVHTSDKETCTLCAKTFKSPLMLYRHLKFVHDKVHAPWRFRSKQNSNHVQCSICKKMLNDKYALTTHISNCHSSEAECDVCGKIFTSKAYRNSHKLRVHDIDGEIYSCPICGKTCKSKRRLRVHNYNSHRNSS